MVNPTKIADAVKEVFAFPREWNSADQRQKRYALRRIQRVKKAADIAECIFFVVDDMLVFAHKKKLSDDSKFRTLEKRYRKLVQKFNELD